MMLTTKLAGQQFRFQFSTGKVKVNSRHYSKTPGKYIDI